MSQADDATPITLAVLASVLAHVLLIGPVIAHLDDPSTTFAPPTRASHLPSPTPPQVPLGIEQSTTSTLTWIGYEAYQEHLARTAEQDQAAMDATVDEVQHPGPGAGQPLPPLSAVIDPLAEAAQQAIEALRGLRIEVPSPALEPVPEVAEVDDPSAPGAPSDIDADPTSRVDVPPSHWKTGKPVAAEGLVLRPRRPSFTAHQVVTNAPGGMLAALHLDQRGHPVKVEVLEGTGSDSIDRSLRASLFRWRAAGDRIDALDEGETIYIEITIRFRE